MAEKGLFELFPEAFVARSRALLGAEADRFLEALASPPQGLRVNTLRLTVERFLELSPFELVPLPYPPAGFQVTGGPRPGRHPYHAAGLYYLQDPAAMAAAQLLDPRPGERVLDLAAAPGGKTTHIAALLRGAGVLVANEIHPGRARELIGNLERCGVRNAIVTSAPADRLADHFGAYFDRVLLDAPCSGEAMFHRSELLRCEWSPAAVAGCARRQLGLLREAARLVRPGGRLLYATCTFSPEEDEEVVARFLEERSDFELVDAGPVPGAEAGRPDWVPAELARGDLARTLRLWPHRAPGAGHFFAVLRRVQGEEADPGRWPAARPPQPAVQALEAFRREYLIVDGFDRGRLVLSGAELYLLPEDAPAPGRLRVLRPAWWLGTVRKDRFEPSHALAMGLSASNAREPLILDPEEPDVYAYLRGAPLSRPGEPGWVLVTVDGFPLGWGKRTGEVIKNHYPKGLRWPERSGPAGS